VKNPKPFARSGEAGGPTAAQLKRVQAYRRLFNGNGAKEDGEIVLSDLTNYVGYYRRPTYKKWMTDHGKPDGYELHCALCSARAEVIQYILDFVMLDDNRLVALEKAARLERITG
jgi:hypothetical protein